MGISASSIDIFRFFLYSCCNRQKMLSGAVFPFFIETVSVPHSGRLTNLISGVKILQSDFITLKCSMALLVLSPSDRSNMNSWRGFPLCPSKAFGVYGIDRYSSSSSQPLLLSAKRINMLNKLLYDDTSRKVMKNEVFHQPPFVSFSICARTGKQRLVLIRSFQPRKLRLRNLAVTSTSKQVEQLLSKRLVRVAQLLYFLTSRYSLLGLTRRTSSPQHLSLADSIRLTTSSEVSVSVPRPLMDRT